MAKITDFDEDGPKKSHQAPRAGPKAEKKKAKKSKDTPKEGEKLRRPLTLAEARKRNPKAFSIQHVVRAERHFRRTQDISEKKTHVPAVDRAPIEPPPFVVAVVGPTNSGKTTLIRCLIKNFTRQSLTTIKGPITVVSGKKRRITLIECNNDLNSMIDVAKVADLALLLVDASYGFEMDTFEFLNICQVHGFPRIMGVLTHLDLIENSKKLKKTKKAMKHRFWTEIYQGAKLFYLSKLLKGSYLRNEIKNLGRFISVMKFRPLNWRSTRPYMLVDRVEDITSDEKVEKEPHCNRTLCLFGYSRGSFFKEGQSTHIPGVGDFQVTNISFLNDPCPIPEKRENRRKSLTDKEKLLYAPMAGVGGLLYDKDAVYIDLKGSHSHTQERSDKEEEKLVRDLRLIDQPLGDKMKENQVKLFSDMDVDILSDDSGQAENDDDDEQLSENDIASDAEDDEENAHDSDDSYYADYDENKQPDEAKPYNIKRRQVSFNDVSGSNDAQAKEQLPYDDEDDDDDDDHDIGMKGLDWKNNLLEKAAISFYERLSNMKNIQSHVYGDTFELKSQADDEDASDDLLDGLLKIKKKADSNDLGNTWNSVEVTRFPHNDDHDWSDESVLDGIRDAFVTGTWDEDTDAEALLKKDEQLGLQDDEDCLGDFEDLEAQDSPDPNDGDKDVDMNEDDGSADDDDEDDDKEPKVRLSKKEARLEKIRKKKEAKKLMFDALYDEAAGGESKNFVQELKEEAERQTALNREEFQDLSEEQKAQFMGFRAGLYLRMEIHDVPCELIDHFNAEYPLIVGGLLHGESNVGYSQVRVKRHRWYKRILKTRDPLIISLGWRRFQTLPVFSIEDTNGRNRLLKYTPQHLHCFATFWGPLSPQNTGFVAFQSVSDEGRDVRDFRIAATGIVLNLDKSISIVKKLKLVGYPLQVYKKTAFIKDMFNSALEVVKFEGASIRTVSGLRGEIKKAIKKPEGAFRATFEDKILMSDIVFMRTWFTINVPKFYTLVKNLLIPHEERLKWIGMRTSGQIRYEEGLKAPLNKDSLYRPTQRKKFAFKPLKIPNKLQAALPYSAKPKYMLKKDERAKRVAVIREPHEQKVVETLQMVRAAHIDKRHKERLSMAERAQKHKKQLEKIEERRHDKQKQVKKQIFRKMSKAKNPRKPKASQDDD